MSPHENAKSERTRNMSRIPIWFQPSHRAFSTLDSVPGTRPDILQARRSRCSLSTQPTPGSPQARDHQKLVSDRFSLRGARPDRSQHLPSEAAVPSGAGRGQGALSATPSSHLIRFEPSWSPLWGTTPDRNRYDSRGLSRDSLKSETMVPRLRHGRRSSKPAVHSPKRDPRGLSRGSLNQNRQHFTKEYLKPTSHSETSIALVGTRGWFYYSSRCCYLVPLLLDALKTMGSTGSAANAGAEPAGLAQHCIAVWKSLVVKASGT